MIQSAYTADRDRLVMLIVEDIESHGWRVKQRQTYKTGSVYLRCQKGRMWLVVRVSDHAPTRFDGCSVHPGGMDRKQLIRRLNRKPPQREYRPREDRSLPFPVLLPFTGDCR